MTIYTFHDSETAVTSTSSAGLTGSDPLLVYSTNAGRTRKTTVASVANQSIVTTATSATTGTNISCFGYTSLGSSSGPITVWGLDDPPQAGILKTISSLSTSTANGVVPVSATIQATDTWVGSKIYFRVPGGSVELVSRSTAIWQVCSRTADIVCT